MTLLVHLWVLTIGRLGVTAAVTIWAVVRIASRGGILSNALCQPWALCSVLGTRRVAGRSRLVADGGKLRVAGSLARHANRLAHLSVHGCFGTVVVAAILFGCALSLLVRLALGLLFLLLGLPFFANFLEFYSRQVSTYGSRIKMRAKQARPGWFVASLGLLKLSSPAEHQLSRRSTNTDHGC